MLDQAEKDAEKYELSYEFKTFLAKMRLKLIQLKDKHNVG
jgi:hypothetical protein